MFNPMFNSNLEANFLKNIKKLSKKLNDRPSLEPSPEELVQGWQPYLHDVHDDQKLLVAKSLGKSFAFLQSNFKINTVMFPIVTEIVTQTNKEIPDMINFYLDLGNAIDIFQEKIPKHLEEEKGVDLEVEFCKVFVKTYLDKK